MPNFLYNLGEKYYTEDDFCNYYIAGIIETHEPLMMIVETSSDPESGELEITVDVMSHEFITCKHHHTHAAHIITSLETENQNAQ